ncbi:MAG: hypothetical protein L3K04_07520 [Thermoplasmata archaeon]|nr:hypothetical protein [Thermoplasmata archaeon]
MSAPYPETLSAEWLPPVLLGRQSELSYLERHLRAFPSASVPRAAVLGPRGSGSSLLARTAAQRWLRTGTSRSGPSGRTVAVRVRWCAGTVGVASALLRAYDEGFGGRGFSVAEIMAGFLRRMVRERRLVAVVLDDASAASPELRPVLHALLRPGEFLPEGMTGSPSWAVLVAGSLPAPALNRELDSLGWVAEERLTLAPYSPPEVRSIVEDRSRRALGHPPAPEWVSRLAEQVVHEGAGANRALDLLREQLLGPERLARPFGPREIPAITSVEPRLLAALARATAAGPCELRSVRRWEQTLARAEGRSPLALTTFWRRMVRLEQMGVLSRELRSGGPGGSRSRIHLHRPLAAGRPELRDWRTPPRNAVDRGARRPPAEAAPMGEFPVGSVVPSAVRRATADAAPEAPPPRALSS